ncbi:hypothetical protein ACLOJK_028792 [Asimina triloba]
MPLYLLEDKQRFKSGGIDNSINRHFKYTVYDTPLEHGAPVWCSIIISPKLHCRQPIPAGDAPDQHHLCSSDPPPTHQRLFRNPSAPEADPPRSQLRPQDPAIARPPHHSPTSERWRATPLSISVFPTPHDPTIQVTHHAVQQPSSCSIFPNDDRCRSTPSASTPAAAHRPRSRASRPIQAPPDPAQQRPTFINPSRQLPNHSNSNSWLSRGQPAQRRPTPFSPSTDHDPASQSPHPSTDQRPIFRSGQ